MKKNILLSLALFLGLCAAGSVQAQTASAPAAPAAGTTPASSPAQTAQTNKMKTCAAQYHQQNIPKDQYHAFMSTCLKKGSTTGTTPAATPPAPATAPAATGVTKTSTSATVTQQEKMKSCNADAKTQSLTGDARKTFMKSCLSK